MEKVIDEHITVYLSITGWTAVHRVLIQDTETGDEYWDNQQTGIGKYKTREKAMVEARSWGKSDEIKVLD